MKTKKRKKILILGSFHGNNWGDLAILDTELDCVDFKRVDVSVLSKSSEKLSEVLPKKYSGKIKFVSPFNAPRLMWSIMRSDLVIVGGGGLFFDYGFWDAVCMMRKSQILVWCILSIFAKLTFSRVFWIGVGAGPLSWFGQKIVGFAARFVDRIEVRDRESHALLLHKIGISKTQKASDIVFLRKNVSKIKEAFGSKPKSKLRVLVTFKHSNADFDQYKKILGSMMNDFGNLELVLFSTNPLQDNPTNSKLASVLDLKFLDTSEFTLSKFYKMFGSFDVVISMRMHALLLGLQEGCVGVGISSEPHDGSGEFLNKVCEMQNIIYAAPLYVEKLDYGRIKSVLNEVVYERQKFVDAAVERYSKNYDLALENFDWEL